MFLNDIGMIAAETSRSSIYLQALARNHLLPGFVLVLANPTNKALPGQLTKAQVNSEIVQIRESDDCWSEASFNKDESILTTLSKNNIPYSVSDTNDIHDPSILNTLKSRPESVFIYSGYGGVLLKREMFDTGKYFLHIHGGFLPDYKGSTTNYFSLIYENSIGASAIFLNEQIDSGPILHRRSFPPPENKLEIDHIYDSAARAKVLIETLQAYVTKGKWEFAVENNTGGETYYIIHPVLKHIAILCDSQDADLKIL